MKEGQEGYTEAERMQIRQLESEREKRIWESAEKQKDRDSSERIENIRAKAAVDVARVNKLSSLYDRIVDLGVSALPAVPLFKLVALIFGPQ